MSIPLDHATRFEQTRRSRITLRRLAIWISLGLICLAAFSALTLMQGIDRQLRDVTETYAVRNVARELSQSLSQAEASQRGFLLTQNPEFLEPYRLAVSSIDQRVEALLQMTADDVDQTGRVRSIAGDISGKMAEMARTVALVQAEREDEAQSLVASGMGARLMSEVSETLEDFIAEEDQKLEARNRAIDQTRVGLVGALIAALLAAAILAYALLSRAQRQVSDLAQRQRGLVGLNEALEAEVAERTRDIEEARAHAERERQRVETLLQDANHRIGNSLATVSSLLALQMMRVRSDEVKVALEAARLRVHAIASAHRRLRLGGDLESASADEFLQAVLDDISATQTNQRRVSIIGEIDAINVSARDATTLGILLGELVTNALKHAFPDNRKGTITVRLNRDNAGVVTLTVADDGVGLAADHAVSENGLGSVIVRQLSAQFGGEPVYTAGDQGLTVSIKLPNLSRAPAAPVER
ncbi:sensor histidine kinase [Devosia aurantiaca]|uniref:histidine kinase n=1 Tax=Devosia aurantiaca TaxID=2714858 RepID=A0A6M1SVA9_9HYPH|nr:CHASE3 domain-containing protein [Devosia aurantiaca]NGP18323.1 histidine kinase [Devosia aurantiaca]